MQAYAGLPQTGILDSETKKLMNTSRCGMADIGRAHSARRKRRYNIQGTTWNKQVTHMRIPNFLQSLDILKHFHTEPANTLKLFLKLSDFAH